MTPPLRFSVKRARITTSKETHLIDITGKFRQSCVNEGALCSGDFAERMDLLYTGKLLFAMSGIFKSRTC